MTPIIWGMDLREMRWGNFKSSYMFGNKDYHMRRTKFVVYQLAMIFCVVSESLGTAALSSMVKLKLVEMYQANSLNQTTSTSSLKSKGCTPQQKYTTTTI